MKESRLVTGIQSLTPIERRAFDKFLHSPYFNKREDLTRLYSWLEKKILSRKQEFKKEDAWRFVYPGKSFDDTNCRLLMSYLTKLFEKFLIIESANSDTVFQKKQLMFRFREKGMQKAYLKARKQLSAAIENAPARSADFYDSQYQILLERFRDEAVQQLKEPFPLQEFANQPDIGFIIKKLRQTCLLLNQKNIVKTDVEIGLLEEIIQYILEKDLIAIPAVGTYYYAYLTLSNSDEESHFEKLIELILKSGEVFPDDELQELHFLAINYCVRKINTGNESYFAKMLNLYKEGLRTETLFQNGKLTRFTYHNIVAAAIKTEDFDWAEGFIESYNSFLNPQYQSSSFSYNIARLAYSRGDFDTSLFHLQKANYKDILLNLAAKTLAAKIYFETDETDLLQSHLEAMKIYIRRKRVMGYHQTNYLNIVRLMQKLAALNFYDRDEKNNFQAEISKTDPLTERKWFTEQLNK